MALYGRIINKEVRDEENEAKKRVLGETSRFIQNFNKDNLFLNKISTPEKGLLDSKIANFQQSVLSFISLLIEASTKSGFAMDSSLVIFKEYSKLIRNYNDLASFIGNYRQFYQLNQKEFKELKSKFDTTIDSLDQIIDIMETNTKLSPYINPIKKIYSNLNSLTFSKVEYPSKLFEDPVIAEAIVSKDLSDLGFAINAFEENIGNFGRLLNQVNDGTLPANHPKIRATIFELKEQQSRIIELINNLRKRNMGFEPSGLRTLIGQFESLKDTLDEGGNFNALVQEGVDPQGLANIIQSIADDGMDYVLGAQVADDSETERKLQRFNELLQRTTSANGLNPDEETEFQTLYNSLINVI